MDHDRQQDLARVRMIFDEVVQLPPQQRAEALTARCGSDTDLRRRLEAMIATAEGEESFLSSPTRSRIAAGIPSPAGAGSKSAPVTERAGSSIGPYKLLQEIGEGGFGVVFMAEQNEPVRRRVALKIIKLGMDTRQVVARFEQERQALALMDHPHIAKVLDAGTTPLSDQGGGRPYFVMEYVKGDPITAFADAHKLSVRARLELFAQVCQAVQHAHTKGVIHRDLKPSNVLVSMTDGRAFAKVIDFGIAKATGARLTDKTLFTEHRQLIGTPEYMSPEQAEGSPDIDTRTDVYSLGVLLYELLTGVTPFDGTRLRSAAWGEMQRIIKEEDPPMPSVRLSRELASLAATASARAVEPARLSGLVHGELDWIVMKALDKDRARRYESPNQLAEDVQRHLGGEAVVAAPASAGYRLRKFVKRNKQSVLTTTVIAFGLLAGIVIAMVGLVRAHAVNIELAASKAKTEAQRDLVRGGLEGLVGYVGFGDDLLETSESTTVTDDDGSRHATILRMERDADGHVHFTIHGVQGETGTDGAFTDPVAETSPSIESSVTFLVRYAKNIVDRNRKLTESLTKTNVELRAQYREAEQQLSAVTSVAAELGLPVGTGRYEVPDYGTLDIKQTNGAGESPAYDVRSTDEQGRPNPGLLPIMMLGAQAKTAMQDLVARTRELESANQSLQQQLRRARLAEADTLYERFSRHWELGVNPTYEEARKQLDAVIQTRTELLGPGHIDTVKAIWARAMASESTEHEALMERAASQLEQAGHEPDDFLIRKYAERVGSYCRESQIETAQHWIERLSRTAAKARESGDTATLDQLIGWLHNSDPGGEWSSGAGPGLPKDILTRWAAGQGPITRAQLVECFVHQTMQAFVGWSSMWPEIGEQKRAENTASWRSTLELLRQDLDKSPDDPHALAASAAIQNGLGDPAAALELARRSESARAKQGLEASVDNAVTMTFALWARGEHDLARAELARLGDLVQQEGTGSPHRWILERAQQLISPPAP